jgi:dephospho-CoA kinase
LPMQNNKKLMIGICGELLSGKSTAASFIIKKYGAKYLKFSGLIAQALEVLNLPQTRENLQDLGSGLKECLGPMVWVDALIAEGKESSENVLLFEGIRKEDEALELQKYQAKIIFIKAAPEVRYKRSLARFEKPGEEHLTFEQFVEHQKHSADQDIPKVEKIADFIINNNGSQEQFFLEVENIMQKIGAGHE